MIDLFKFMRKDDDKLLKVIEELNSVALGETVPLEPKKEEIIKKKKLILIITTYDGTIYKSHYIMDAEEKYTPITINYGFYKWYFFRGKSKLYNFTYKDGCRIFKRKDIKLVEFKTEFFEENKQCL